MVHAPNTTIPLTGILSQDTRAEADTRAGAAWHDVCDVQVEGIGYDFIPKVLDRSVVSACL